VASGTAQESNNSGSDYNNIPAELTALPQWVCANADKIPINPRTGRYASTTDPATWGTYEKALEAGHPYIGFVFTDGDPYAGIDLDHPETSEQEERHQKIVKEFESYTETSRSGKGVHIIVKGKIPNAVKRDNVEVYDEKRYFIFTGKAINDQAIYDRQELLDKLVEQMPASKAIDDCPELVQVDNNVPDELVLAEARSRSKKFGLLWEGKWQGSYDSHSEPDYALMGFISESTPDNKQARRLFRQSGLGQRKKAQREDYLNNMLKQFRAKQAALDEIQFDPDFVKGPFTSDPDPVGNSALTTVPSPPSITLPRVKIADLTPDVQLPPQEEVVSKHLPVGVPTLLAAHGGAGKSMLGLQLAACVASGREFMGLSTMRVPVTIYSAEDSTLDLRHRLKRIFTYYKINPKTVADSLDVRDVTDINSALYVEHSVSGVRSGTTTHVYNALLDACELNNSRLVIIDNASDVFEANENDRTLVRGFMRSLAQLARVIDGAVLLLAHVNKVTAMNGSRSESYSGSTAWHNSARSRQALTETEGGLVLSHEKANRGERCHDIPLSWTNDGLLVPGHVQFDGVRDGPDLEQILGMFEEHTKRGDPVSTSRTNGNAYSVLSPLDGFPVGMNRNRFLKLINRAEKDGRMRRVVYKTKQRKESTVFEVVDEPDSNVLR